MCSYPGVLERSEKKNRGKWTTQAYTEISGIDEIKPRTT